MDSKQPITITKEANRYIAVVSCFIINDYAYCCDIADYDIYMFLQIIVIKSNQISLRYKVATYEYMKKLIKSEQVPTSFLDTYLTQLKTMTILRVWLTI